MNLTVMEQELERDEGLRLSAYKDPAEKLTIGVGRNLDDNPLSPAELLVIGHDCRTQPITKEQALYLLGNDIKATTLCLDRFLPWWANMDEVRKRVLINMCFNLGISRLLQFKETLHWMQLGHYNAAASCMAESKWAAQVGQRAVRLENMMRTGVV